MTKKWVLQESNTEIVQTLHQQLQIHPVLCKLLAQRGIHNYDQAKEFFRPNSSQLHSPFLMKGMEQAIARIQQAIAENEKILLFGDYDVDGTTAVAVVYSFFKPFYEHIEYYIPHRFTEGYGVSQKGIDYAVANNIKLIITLDCGIKSAALITYAKQQGVDTVVCDHHLPDDTLPPAIAILNPKQADCNYPYNELCGCGIGFKLIQAYAEKNPSHAHAVFENIDLVATAIAADIVPITGENRVLCVLGLKKVNSNPCIALQVLKQISAFDRPFTITDLVFIIAPRVNAAGRMDDARKAVELFIEKDITKARDIALLLNYDNSERVEVDKETTLEALQLLETEEQLSHCSIVYQVHWHKGVVGIVASRLIEQHYKPTIVLTESNGFITGSARSIKGFNMFDGLTQCHSLLENYGGHYFAAGLTLKHENLATFKTTFNTAVSLRLQEKDFIPEIEMDSEMLLTDITASMFNILTQFAPHGPLNMKPTFVARNVRNYEHKSCIVKEKHIRFFAEQHGKTITGIGFNLAHKFDILLSKPSFDMVFQIEENIWKDKKSLQLKVIDIT